MNAIKPTCQDLRVHPDVDPRRQRTREALIAAAERLLATRAIDDVGVDELAKAAGVAVGSIYNAFGSKAALHAAVVDRALDLDSQYMDLAYTAPRSPVEQLQAAADQYFQLYLDHPEFFRLLAFPPEPGRFSAATDTTSRLAQRVDRHNARLISAFERGIAEETIAPVDVRQAATVLWASWNGIISLAWRPDELRKTPDELRVLLRLATDIVSWGLRRERRP
jgi:AcrR family transcriptional regulator